MVRNIQSATWEKVPVKRIGVRTVELLLPYLVQIAQPIADLQKQDRHYSSFFFSKSSIEILNISETEIITSKSQYRFPFS